MKYKFIEIETIEKIPFNGIVNDLSVDTNHSYSVYNTIVHNSGCLTSANTGVHFPMASLIYECYQYKKKESYNTKIVADGGFRNYDDIIKAIMLGADYVMLGGILNKCLLIISTQSS